MSTVRPSVICDRVRSQISLELDGELSQLEQAMVSSHLERCSECRAYRDDVDAITTAVRAAPLEGMEPIALRKPRRVIAARLQVGGAAAFAVVALGVAGQIATAPQGPAPAPSGSREIKYPTLRAIEREQAMLRQVNSGQKIRLVLDGFVL
jgi:anti-sigma factor RsiW